MGRVWCRVHSVQSYASHPTGTIIQQCHTDDSMSSHCGMFVGRYNYVSQIFEFSISS